jgi:acid phosphatase family membrane protein YuiD
MNIGVILRNHVLLTALAGWFIAQILKVLIDLIREHKVNWGLFFSVGGMPSSHSALVTSTAMAAGLYTGFDSPIFAIAVTIAMVVVYDATGVRRQAGMQAQTINVIVEELLQGHPISEQHLREVLGHTPLEAISGVLLGLLVASLMWLGWH